jgi:hypothetical protein
MPYAVPGTTLVATILAVLLLTGLPLAQERKPPSLEVTLEWLGTKMPQAAYVDSQGDRWEWQPSEMTACGIQVRETIHASGGPLATEYTIPLADVASVNSLDGLAVSAHASPDDRVAHAAPRGGSFGRAR